MVELPPVIKARLTTIWAARGRELKRLMHELYNVTPLTRGFQHVNMPGSILIAFFSTSLFTIYFTVIFLPSFSLNPLASLQKHKHEGWLL